MLAQDGTRHHGTVRAMRAREAVLAGAEHVRSQARAEQRGARRP